MKDYKERKLQLHYWYVNERESNGKKYNVGHGVVTGHKRIDDSVFIHTSEALNVEFDEENKEVLIKTRNSLYHCPVEYCRFEMQDKNPDLIPGYEELKNRFKDKIEYPSIEPGKVLLVLANFCDYYFHSVYYVPADSQDGEKKKYRATPHIGTFQDSFLIDVAETRMDLRYFPHYRNIEFYSEETCGLPWFIENIGDVELYAKTGVGTIRLAPGERKEVKKENAEKEPPMLMDGDLYPAMPDE